MDQQRILITGGSGLLGSTLKQHLPQASFPTSSKFDVTNYTQMQTYLQGKNITTLLHAAAFTSPPKVNENPIKAMSINIVGTANVVKLCEENNIKLIYISTDYVFQGDRGMYKEEDPVHPQNKYAWSKLGGECAVRMYDNSIIVRTTFGPDEFPYPKAFIDQWTSRESVSSIASLIIKLFEKPDVMGTIHVGGRRKTVMEHAKKISPHKEVGELSICDVDFNPPKDTSMDISRYEDTFGKTALG